ncbi:MAG: ribonuclease P protein component [Candidatus Hydrothermae bacterium]|nr:ribonuclease P protein component [Candidatus Hydrothermae bacterium]
MRKEGLPRREILKRGKDFNHILREGLWEKGDYFVIYYRWADGKRAGFAASRKIDTKVKRNRAKRLMREIYRKNRDLLPNGHYVFMALPSILGADFDELLRSFEVIAEKIRKRRKNGENGG